MSNQLTVKEWVIMFREIGLDQAQMDKWHTLFEGRHPADHQRFLQWLGLAPEEIDRIRSRSK